MSDWVAVAAEEDLPPGAFRTVDVDGTQVAVFNLDGTYYAIEDVCTHDGGILTGGAVEGDVIVCPRHGARQATPKDQGPYRNLQEAGRASDLHLLRISPNLR